MTDLFQKATPLWKTLAGVILASLIFFLIFWKFILNHKPEHYPPPITIESSAVPVVPTDEHSGPSDIPVNTQDIQTRLSPSHIMAQMADAAEKATLAKPVEHVPPKRPAFVSQVEWDILQEIAGKAPDKDVELTLLVNKLLFFKKFETWKSMKDAGDDSSARRQLAGDMLAMLPLIEKDLGPKLSQDMKNDILAD